MYSGVGVHSKTTQDAISLPNVLSGGIFFAKLWKTDTERALTRRLVKVYHTPCLQSPYHPQAIMEHIYSTPPQTWGTLIVSVCVLFGVVGCSPVEDTHTGTYREQIAATANTPSMALEFMRLGDDAMGVMRLYQAPLLGEPFSTELSCVWTQLAEAPNEEGTFQFDIAPGGGASKAYTIKGRFVEDGVMNVQVIAPDSAEVESKVLYRDNTKSTPNSVCNTIDPFLIRPQFERNDAPQVLSESFNYTLKRPVFAALWLGITTVNINGAQIFVGKESIEPSFFLLDQLHQVPNGIKGEAALSLNPPDEDILIRSGQTKYGLAHPVIIDDKCDVDAQGQCSEAVPERFRWNPSEEPIIATLLSFGREPSQDFPPDAEGLGKAVFFVEGSLDQLDDSLRERILNIDQYGAGYNKRHFYIVDVFFRGDQIISMRLPKDPKTMFTLSYRALPLRVTRDFLSTQSILLPRLQTLDKL